MDADEERPTQYVFPADRLLPDATGVMRRPHLDPSGLHKAIKQVTRQAGVAKRVSAHTFRHRMFFIRLCHPLTGERI